MTVQQASARVPGGLLIAIEGIDGAGKTTQAAAVADRLRSAGFEVVRTKEPTDGPWGRRLRASAASGRLSAEAELDAFVEDRKEHVRDLIRPALERGAVVIVDRYYFSNMAYQGARGLDPLEIQRRNEAIAPVPHVLVLLRTDAAVGVARIRARGDQANLFEREDDLRRAAAIFDSIRTPGLLTLDGHRAPEEITAAILERVVECPLYQAMCLRRPRPDECEPVTCSHRIAGRCEWVGVRGSLVPIVDGRLDAVRAIAKDTGISPADKVRLVAAMSRPDSTPPA